MSPVRIWQDILLAENVFILIGIEVVTDLFPCI